MYERLRDVADLEQELLGSVRPTTAVTLRVSQDRCNLVWRLHEYGLGMLILALIAHLAVLRG